MNIKAIDLSLRIGRTPILEGINFEMNGPKIYGLLGRNGAGKTTLLSILGSFRKQTSGQLYINGEAPFENPNIMEQVTFLYTKDYTGETDNVKDMLKAQAELRPYFDLEYAMELVNKFKLDTKKGLSKLSTGKQSIFNAISGLATRCPITIFDEVYLGMDAPAREIFYEELLIDQERYPRIIILSTHLVSEMEYLFDEVLIINEGSLLIHEPYDELLTRGVTITGHKDTVEAFVANKEILKEEQLGATKAITLYGNLTASEENTAMENGLTVGPVSLQDLFVQLTKEENKNEF